MPVTVKVTSRTDAGSVPLVILHVPLAPVLQVRLTLGRLLHQPATMAFGAGLWFWSWTRIVTLASQPPVFTARAPSRSPMCTVFAGAAVGDGDMVGVGVRVDVAVAVAVGVAVTVGVDVAVGVLVGVRVGVAVAVAVRVAVGVAVAVAVGVRVSVGVDVTVAVLVGVRVGVRVGVLVGVRVGVRVDVAVGVGVFAWPISSLPWRTVLAMEAPATETKFSTDTVSDVRCPTIAFGA